MAQQTIFLGTNPNDGTGETLRGGGGKINDNFTELYALQSDTINAGAVAYNFTGATKEQRIALADADAVLLGKSTLFIPASLLPYDITLCPASAGVQRVREGGDFSVYDVRAYGASGDTVTQDYAAFAAAIAGAGLAESRVVIPGSTGKYLVNQTLVLLPNITVEGRAAGLATPIVRFNGGTTTMFHFEGSAEAQPLSVALRDFQMESATNQVGIGLRLRNFADCFLTGMHLNHFRVGVWADWGQNLYISNGSKFVLNTRGIQLGGNLSQTETPIPAAGIRASPGTPYMDMVTIRDAQFSQNEIDINDMGSQQSLGVLVIDGCRFFESAASPVSGKTKYLNVTRRKALRFTGNFVESPNANREGIHISAFDYDGNFADANYGFSLENNYFLLTGASGDCVYVEAGSGVIQGNVFERPSGTARHLSLMDNYSGRAVMLGQNTYMDYADVIAIPRIRVSGGSMHDIFRTTAPLIKALTYSASMTVDPAVADTFTVTATNGTAFAFVLTTASLRVGYLTIEILNSSGGVLGTATFTGFTLTGGAWTQPANTQKRSITFFNNGSSYIEMSRSANDY